MVNHTEDLPNLRHSNNTQKKSKTTNNIIALGKSEKRKSIDFHDAFLNNK